MEPSGPRSDRPVLWTVTGSDGSDSFSLKRRRPASFFFFSPKRRRSETAPTYFFFPPIRRHFASLKIPLLKPPFLISQSLFWNPQNHSSLPLSNPHTLKSQSLPRAVAPSQLILSPSRRRTSQLSLSPASPSQRSLDRSSLVAVAAQPRYDYVVLVGCDLWFMIA